MDDILVCIKITLHFNTIQKMIEYIVIYLVIGVLLTMFVDYWTIKLDLDESKLTSIERFLSVILWFFIIVLLIIDFIINKDNDE